MLGNSLLGLGQAFLVDQRLQILDLLLQARGALDQQVFLAVAQVLQQAVAGQFLAAQRGHGIEGGQLGIELVALLGRQDFAGILAGLEHGIDLLDARLVVANFGLGALGAGLRGNALGGRISQGFLQLVLLGTALSQQLFELRHLQVGIALLGWNDLGHLQLGQFMLVFGGLPRGFIELLFDGGQALFAVVPAGKKGQGLFQYLLQGLLVGFGQFAFGDFVQALLNGGCGGWFGGLGATGGQAQTQQGCG
ncbi:hypothetical protein D3C84_304250 [compost metagenome]